MMVACGRQLPRIRAVGMRRTLCGGRQQAEIEQAEQMRSSPHPAADQQADDAAHAE